MPAHGINNTLIKSCAHLVTAAAIWSGEWLDQPTNERTINRSLRIFRVEWFCLLRAQVLTDLAMREAGKVTRHDRMLLMGMAGRTNRQGQERGGGHCGKHCVLGRLLCFSTGWQPVYLLQPRGGGEPCLEQLILKLFLSYWNCRSSSWHSNWTEFWQCKVWNSPLINKSVFNIIRYHYVFSEYYSRVLTKLSLPTSHEWSRCTYL